MFYISRNEEYINLMFLSSLFQRHKVKPLWQFRTSGILWRLTFSQTGFIIGEDRDADKKIVTYFCLNVSNGDVLWKDLSFCDPFWSGVKGVIEDKLYIHGFRKPDMPEQHKIVAVDLGTGKELWSRNDISVLSANENELCAFRDFFERRAYYLINAKDGELIAEYDKLPETYIPREDFTGKTNFQYPQPSQLTTELKNLIEQFAPTINIKGQIEIIEYKNLFMCSFHQKEKNNPDEQINYSHHFLLIDNSKTKLLYKEVLNSSTPNIVPDSYFLGDDILFLLKEKSAIIAININSI